MEYKTEWTKEDGYKWRDVYERPGHYGTADGVTREFEIGGG